MFAVFCLWGRGLISLFLDSAADGEVIAMAAAGARIYGLCFLASGFNIVQSGYYTALGDAVSSILIAASRGIVFVALGLVLFPGVFGLNGVWFSLRLGSLPLQRCAGCCIWANGRYGKYRDGGRNDECLSGN